MVEYDVYIRGYITVWQLDTRVIFRSFARDATMYKAGVRSEHLRLVGYARGSVPFLPCSQSEKKSCTSPAERPRARRDSDGTGLCSPIMHAALAAMRPIEARVGLHEDGCRAVLVSAIPLQVRVGESP